MTQSSLQTQCPNCQTRFRVTDEQLGVAKGKVRCGNCMEVFNAIEHQVTPGSSIKKETPAAPSTPEDEFLFADNPEEDAADGPYAGSKLTFSEDELSDSFRTADTTDGTDFQDSDDDIARHDIDESWADAILEDDKWQAPEPETPEEPEAANFEVATEFDQLQDHSSPAAPTSVAVDEAEQDISGDTEAEQLPDSDQDPAPSQPEESIDAGMPFNDLRREPLSVDNSNNGKLRTVVWSLIVLVLAGALIAQVTWFQFDRLSAIPELRPFYEKGCQLAGCDLEPLIDTSNIKTRKLVVRTDPENRTHLLVDAVIINQADFEQPFPAIALTFANLNGDVVAQSIFTPSEYLAGEGQKLEIMPKDTPVRIAISIRDPGRDAVNYNIAFRPASL